MVVHLGFSKFISDMQAIDYQHRLRILNLYALGSIPMHAGLMEAIKQLNMLFASDSSKPDSLKLQAKADKTKKKGKIRKYFFQRFTVDWNNLLPDMVAGTNMDQFVLVRRVLRLGSHKFN